MSETNRKSDRDPHKGEKTGSRLLRMMAWGIMTTHLDEIGCDECFDLMDRFVEMVLSGKDAAAIMPLVQDHLNRCNGCREEYEALLVAVRTVSR